MDRSRKFSTFLQKPKTPASPKKVGSYWHYPKAPHYLPPRIKEPSEEPRRRKESHSVLWLFLGKEGNKVVDERWGTQDEEKRNVSRNTNRDDEGVIMPPLSQCNTPQPMLEDELYFSISKLQRANNHDDFNYLNQNEKTENDSRVNEPEAFMENGNSIGEFEECDTAVCDAAEPPKRPFHALSPSIVLPCETQWRRPEDVIHNDFYQGIHVESADVLIGNNKSINFKKYVPPRFDTDVSPVCKLIRELETMADENRCQPEKEFYHTPLTERHIFNPSLPQPPRVDIEEWNDLF